MTLYVTHMPLFVTFPLAALCLTVACFLPMLLLSPTSTQRKGMEMIIRIGRLRIGPVDECKAEDEKERLNQIAMEQEHLEQAKAMYGKPDKDFKDMHDGKPSSKIGREIYYSNLGFFGLPAVLFENIKNYLSGTSVWYSDDGRRITIFTVIGRM